MFDLKFGLYGTLAGLLMASIAVSAAYVYRTRMLAAQASLAAMAIELQVVNQSRAAAEAASLFRLQELRKLRKHNERALKSLDTALAANKAWSEQEVPKDVQDNLSR